MFCKAVTLSPKAFQIIIVTGKKEIIIQVAKTLRLNLFVLFPDRIGWLKMWLVYLL